MATTIETQDTEAAIERVIGLYIAHVAPVPLRLIVGDKLEKGPWHLGAWGRPLAVISVLWVAFITVLFVLPQVSPFTVQTFNHAGVAVLGVLLSAGGWWLLGARKWFTGPRVQGTPEELAAIERSLEIA